MESNRGDWSSSFDWGSFVFRPDANNADYERDPLHRFFSEDVDEDDHIYDVDKLHALLADYPQKKRKTDGNFPLHTAWTTPSSSMSAQTLESLLVCIQALIRSFPDAAKEKNRRGYLPLHLSLQRDHVWCRGISMADSVLETLLESHKEALATKTDCGELPLHLVLKNLAVRGGNSSTILKLVTSYPQALREFSSQGHTPIQMLLLSSNWTEEYDGLMKTMVDHWEDALWTPSKNSTSYLPLHLACHRGHVSCIYFLFRAYPQACGVPTVGTRGNLLPLQLALTNFFSNPQTVDLATCRDITCLLGKEYPQGFYHNSHDVLLGSSIFLDSRLIDSLPVLRNMFGSLDAFVAEIFCEPAAVTARYPLHEACREGAPLEVIQSMIRVFDPVCLQQKDENGYLPLHYAAASTSFRLVETLLEANGAALGVSCLASEDRGSYRPFERGMFFGARQNLEKATSVLYVLLRAYPDVVLDYSWNA